MNPAPAVSLACCFGVELLQSIKCFYKRCTKVDKYGNLKKKRTTQIMQYYGLCIKPGLENVQFNPRHSPVHERWSKEE